MANTMMGAPNLGFVNALKADSTAGADLSKLTNPSNYVSINAMRSRLTALNATLYTAAELDRMTVNDMIFALRMLDDKTTISNYQV